MDSQQTVDKRVRLILRFPYKRPEDFVQPQVQPADPFSVEEQVWRCLLSLPGPDQPQDILAELEQDQVTFDWELLAETLKVPLAEVFEAASSLFYKHMGRPLELGEQGIQLTPAPPLAVEQLLENTDESSSSSNARLRQAAQMTESIIVKEPAEYGSDNASSHSTDHPANSREFTGLRSVESLGNGEQAEAPGSPAVELSTATPTNNHGSQQLDSQSVELEQPTELLAQDHSNHKQERRVSSSSSSFSDLSNSSLTESAMQDALISEGMNASTAMSSLLGSRMFPWSKKRR
ncbi:hypothetical protein EV183_004856 [Coemansia sp. RSA 2336]|nr:hypothetical protein EV183_004856 [Coemansia sp. RSA 2336]